MAILERLYFRAQEQLKHIVLPEGSDDRTLLAAASLVKRRLAQVTVIGKPDNLQRRAEALNVSGPFAPDTVFMRARHAPGKPGEFDVVVAMYHDQGLIPVKYLGVEHGVNVTLGLPLVRTSPDHGTAFDIAGTGTADATSLVAALRLAARLAMADNRAPLAAS